MPTPTATTKIAIVFPGPVLVSGCDVGEVVGVLDAPDLLLVPVCDCLDCEPDEVVLGDDFGFDSCACDELGGLVVEDVLGVEGRKNTSQTNMMSPIKSTASTMMRAIDTFLDGTV